MLREGVIGILGDRINTTQKCPPPRSHLKPYARHLPLHHTYAPYKRSSFRVGAAAPSQLPDWKERSFGYIYPLFAIVVLPCLFVCFIPRHYGHGVGWDRIGLDWGGIWIDHAQAFGTGYLSASHVPCYWLCLRNSLFI